jgi:DNA-3-methyladenine glycosylase II
VANDPSSLSRKEAIDHLRRSDPVLRKLIDAHPDFEPRAWLIELPSLDSFGAILFQIAGQQLSVQSTRNTIRRVQGLFDGRLPSPDEVLSTALESLLKTGLSRRKVETLQEVARQFSQGSLSEKKLRSLPDQEVETLLTSIRGIGPWTVQGFLIIALDRPDVVLPGDLALRKAIRRVYGLRRLPSQAEVLMIAEPWRPYRSLATSYLFQAAFDST